MKVLLDEEEDESKVSSVSEDVIRQRIEQFMRDSCKHQQLILAHMSLNTRSNTSLGQSNKRKQT